ncbi:hypothetical protein J5N97_020741 [Dioscorea zingiberensis]|uniref:Response regulatory domain-containing protein n=1 Tax=Dioscorea zingiberensis TaxID=325984 RepID=A0A9D5HE27_9LILI|nr:hypothetical protein J5N97_020741 [Dioscorea zingiberensis]
MAASPTAFGDADEWEVCNDDGFVYKRRRRWRHPESPPLPAPLNDPEAELRRRRRARKKQCLLAIRDKYLTELAQWETLSSSLLTSPLPPPPPVAAAALSPPQPSSQGPPCQPLVDDLLSQAEAQELMLQKLTQTLTTCGLATVALHLLQERKDKFDIVISDVNMPDMDGFKLLEHVGLEMDLPVIMMSVDGETSRVKEIESHDSNEDIQILRTRYEDFDERHVFSGVDSVRKQKDVDNKELADQEYSDSSAVKKARVVWTVDLHQKLVEAVNQIGFDKVGPKKILDLMNVPGLTRENVASHLQEWSRKVSASSKKTRTNDLRPRWRTMEAKRIAPPAKQNGTTGKTEPKQHHLSVPIDSEMVRGKEAMKTYTIVTITKVREGMVTSGILSVALQDALGRREGWSSKQFTNGQYLVECPSPEEARELERVGIIHLPKFSISCELYTPDIDATGKADGECRWVEVKGMPLFCWHRDVAARLLKPVGDLIRIDERGTAFANVIRAALRIRRGEELPTIINVNTGIRKYTLYVRMERGQPRLPWDEGYEKVTLPPIAPASNTGGTEPHPMQNHGNDQGAPKPRATREEKGKSIMTEETEMQNKWRRRPPSGIVIREDDRRSPELGNMENRSDRAHERSQPVDNRRERMRTQRPLSEDRGSAGVTAAAGYDSEVDRVRRTLANGNDTCVPAGTRSTCTQSAPKGNRPPNASKTRGEGGPSEMGNELHNGRALSDPFGPDGNSCEPMHPDGNLSHLDGPITNIMPTTIMNDGPKSHLNYTGTQTLVDEHIEKENPNLTESAPSLFHEGNHIINLGEGLTLDITKMTPRLIQGEWQLITEEVWSLLAEKEDNSLNTKGPSITVAELGGEKEKDKEAPPPPKTRGRPRKNKPEEATNGKHGPTPSKNKRKAHVEETEGTSSNTFSVPLTLATWPDMNMITTALKVGVDIQQIGDDNSTYLAHMRQLEAERAREAIKGGK